ncbi:MAG: DEAD/DEAH box helicase [Candidatus Thorarchaeota archaeon]
MNGSSRVMDMLKDAGLKPRGVQVEAIEAGVLEGSSVMVCSPTGSGKTLVGEMALLRGVENGRRGLYLVPLRALAVQVAAVLRDRYESYQVNIGLSTGDHHRPGEELDSYDILVTTYERADSLLRHGSAWVKEVGVVVVDEVQNLAAETRGARLESVLIRLRKLIEDVQIVALSATVGRPYEVAEWLGCTLVQSNERPVPLRCRVLVTGDREKSVRDIVMTTVQRDGQAIVFNRTRREAEAEANRLAINTERQLMGSEKTALDNRIRISGIDVPIPTDLLPLLHDGVTFHHAGLSAKVRGLIEDLFDEGLLRVICATTTLAAGMDLPARTVVLTTSQSPSDHSDMMSSNSVHQMLGRAGRPGRDKIGFGVILARSRGEANEVIRRYFHNETENEKDILTPKYEVVDSTLVTPRELTDQLLVALDFLGKATLEDANHSYFGLSYYDQCARRDNKAPLRIIELGEIAAEAAIEKHALSDTVRDARAEVMGTAQIRESGSAVIGGMAQERMHGEMYTCRFSARTNRGSDTVEGPQCSCGTPIDKWGILCTHLVNLGLTAIRKDPRTADYVIPLALSESSPSRTLIRLGLVEGDTDGQLKPTVMGMTVNRLFLRTETFRELKALGPRVDDNKRLLWLLRHLISIETGRQVDESFDNIIGTLVTTSEPIRVIARMFEMSTGDLYGLLDTSRWILHCIAAIARVGRLEGLSNRAESLESRIAAQIEVKEE